MERIKKAVEQARQARVARLGGRPVRVPSAEPLAQIVYSETKTFAVRPEILDRHRVLGGLKDETAAVAYKILRTQVLQRMELNDWTTLAITSSCPNEGKTLTAINLAISIAREVSYTVLLVDLDLRKRGLHECFGYTPEADLIDYLERDSQLSDILVSPGIERLVILPSGGPVENSSELLASPKMAGLVNELKSRYASRLVLFDLPPLLAGDDASAFLPNADAALLVVRDAKTTKQELSRSTELMQGRPLLGTVLNRGTEPVAAYY